MQAEFITNASMLITLNSGKTILADPWFSEGVQGGTWYNFPPLNDNQYKKYTSLKPDYIYISHIHTDHLDPATLRLYPKNTTILIGKLPHNHLHRAITKLGFTNIKELPLDTLTQVDDIKICILKQFEGMGNGEVNEVDYLVDSSLFVKDTDGTSLLNVNDNPIKIDDAKRIVSDLGTPDIAFLPYGSASFYPHAFSLYSNDEKAQKRDNVKFSRLNNFIQISKIINAKWTIPAAGSYVVGGRLAEYSKYLALATPAEIASKWANENDISENVNLCLMAAGDVVDAKGGIVHEEKEALFRTYTLEERADYALTLKEKSLPHDLISIPPYFSIPFERLLFKARKNLFETQKKMGVFPQMDIIISVTPTKGVPLVDNKALEFKFALDKENIGEVSGPGRPYTKFRIDSSMLLMVLVSGAIWNNLEGGALVECERQPDIYNPAVHTLMSMFML